MSDQRDGGIAWTDQTWNPTRGCSRVSRGCEHCYAEGVARRFSGPGMPYEGLVRLDRDGKAKAQWNGVVRLVPDHLADPLRWTRQRRVFVNSMSDLFHEHLGLAEIARVFAVMALARRHTFQVLTKRARRAAEVLSLPEFWRSVAVNADAIVASGGVRGGFWSGWEEWASGIEQGRALSNVWLGVSVEDQATADERIPHLLACPASVRWVSYEPALGPVSFRDEWLGRGLCPTHDTPSGFCSGDCPDLVRGLDWIVVGGESGPGARPFDLTWARSTIAQCREAGVACFVKQIGAQPVDGDRSAIIDAHGIAAPSLDHDEAKRLAPGYAGGHVVRPAPVRIRDRKGGDMRAWPEDLRVREWPAR